MNAQEKPDFNPLPARQISPMQYHLSQPHEIYLGLGSNITPEKNLVRSIDLLRQYLNIGKLSSIWETPPVGLSGPNFLNAAIQAWTALPASLLKTLILRRIEVLLGRVRTENKFAPRTIDLDILIYDGQVLDPKVWTHAFLAVPLAEILPNYTHPRTLERLDDIAQRLLEQDHLKRRMDLAIH